LEPLVIRRIPLDALHLDPANARQHGERNLEAITASLQTFGQAGPLVVQQSTGRVVGGNGRLVAMRALKWSECDVVEVDLDNTEATALAIALNRTGELAEWDQDALGKILASLNEAGALDATGFTGEALGQFLGRTPEVK
jgi:ParB-like chromosome segregation protein Spo0J